VCVCVCIVLILSVYLMNKDVYIYKSSDTIYVIYIQSTTKSTIKI